MSDENEESAEQTEPTKYKAEMKLDVPIMYLGEPMDTLKFHELRGKVCRKVGYPFKFLSDGSYELDGSKVSQLLEAYCKLVPGSADLLCEYDHLQAGILIMGFSGPSTS